MPPRSRAATTTTTISTPSKSAIAPRSTRRTRTTHKNQQQQQHEGSLSPDPLDILPFVSPLKLAKREILGGDISSSSTDNTSGITNSRSSYRRKRGRKEGLEQAAVQQPSTSNWSVNVTIAGTDPILPPGQAVSGTKRNIDALEDTRSGGVSSTINFQPMSDSSAAWVQVVRSPSIVSAGTPVREKELRVANAGSTPAVVDSARKRRAVGKRSPRKKEIEKNSVENLLYEMEAASQDNPAEAKARNLEQTVEPLAPTMKPHIRVPGQPADLPSKDSVRNMAIHRESSTTAVHIYGYEDQTDRSPASIRPSSVIEHRAFAERSSSSLNVTQNSKKMDGVESLSRSSSPLKPVSLPPPPHSPVLLSQSIEPTLPLCRVPTKQSSPVPSITSSILTTTELPEFSDSGTFQDTTNPNPDPAWSRAHWVLLTQLHPRRMDPLPSRALVKPPKKIIVAFPGVSEEELARRMLALDRIRLRRELKMEEVRSERQRKEEMERYVGEDVRKYY
ncbi:hypothetical protein V1520DRAFT_335435 [Lipomyces starkeyi]|uniref:Uncharacterized protein n=1 Tax=Lipomyces starkeyi NRRL Y-11557 TaxID=675824 RepID=A0A1E3QBC6_LIPST|nr:hypothetical protein LIPSTDRAFT_69110 [Lipomyces starkeyi NRRL Y-11557]